MRCLLIIGTAGERVEEEGTEADASGTKESAEAGGGGGGSKGVSGSRSMGNGGGAGGRGWELKWRMSLMRRFFMT